MKSLSVRKISVLGLVLMAASAVTAAVLPNRVSDSKTANDGTLQTDATSSDKTCVPNQVGAASCTRTVGSQSTGAGLNSLNANGSQTVGNTSMTAGVAGDQNSVTEQA